jgi:hypothetical protein
MFYSNSGCFTSVIGQFPYRYGHDPPPSSGRGFGYTNLSNLTIIYNFV